MAISTIESAWIVFPPPAEGKLSRHPDAVTAEVLCRITTSDGVEGIGEALGPRPQEITTILNTALVPILVGTDETLLKETWKRLYEAVLGPEVLRPATWTRRAVLAAIGMVDQALWDIHAKRSGVPVCEALGGAPRPIPAFLSESALVNEVLLERVAKAFESCGCDAVKIPFGASIEEGAQNLELARKVLGRDVRIMVDAEEAWELTTAVRAAHRIEEYEPAWLENPIKPHAGLYSPHDGHDANGDTGRLAEASSVPLAVGDNHVTIGACHDLLCRGNITYIRFDAAQNGGVTQWMQVAEYARECGVRMAPHHAPHIHAHLAAAVPHADWIEAFDLTRYYSVWPELYDGFPQVSNGHIRPSDRPGWGLSINEKFLRAQGTLVEWRQ